MSRPALTPRDRGLGHAVRIQKGYPPRQWRAQVDAIEDPAERQVAEDYLRGIIERIRVLLALRKKGQQ
jgi:hypothetical protein